MRPDVNELRAFYASRQGEYVRRLVNHQLRQLDSGLRHRRVLGVGYALPYLAANAGDAMAFMPATQGAVPWPAKGPSRTVLGREDEFPFADGMFDCVLLAHALECSPHANRLMREAWRVLADGGRLIAIVPNRRGLWCWSDRTPFGYGQPYSCGQLERTLRSHLFTRIDERQALFMPPVRSRLLMRMTVPAERVGQRFLPRLAGVLVAMAEKRIYAGTPEFAVLRPSSRRYLPVLEGVSARMGETPARPDGSASPAGRSPRDRTALSGTSR